MHWFIENIQADNNITSQSNPYSLILMLMVFAVAFYFIIFRPQQKRNKDHKKLLNSISKGDEVLTVGGLVGRVIKTTETGYIFVVLNIYDKSYDTNIEVLIKRDCVTAILPKGTMKSL